MRNLAVVLVALVLGGCANNAHNAAKTPLDKASATPKNNSLLQPTATPAPELYSSLDDIAGRSFLTLGSVTGEGCQTTAREFPTDMTLVRRQMQNNARALKANVVMLNSCEILSNVPGCYRQTRCKGSALKVAE